jgi:5,10-methylenetetrahydromethanopterin reductase
MTPGLSDFGEETIMPVGISYAGTYPLKDFLKVAKAADEVGLDSIWLAEEFVYRDPMITAASVLQVTERVRVIPGPVTPYLKHPVAIAREALTLAEISNGRLGLQLGVGDLGGLKQLGVDVSRPLSTVAEALSTIRALCRGEAVSAGGVRMKLGGITAIPLYLAAMGLKMLSLARRSADGTALSHMMSVDYIRKSIEAAEAENGPQASPHHEFVEFFAVSVAEDRQMAYDQIRPSAAHWLGAPYPQPIHVEDWKLCGLDIDHVAIYQALQRQDMEAACKLVSDEAIATLSVSGTPEDFENRIGEYLDAGVTYPIIGPVGDLETIIATMRLAVDIFGARHD